MKQCSGCKELKTEADFRKKKHISKYTGKPTVYIDRLCKDCSKQKCKERRQSIPGMFTDMYNGQLSSSKRRKHTAPDYTQKELKQWIKTQPHFKKLVKAWVDSKYNRWLKPSCDRLDNTKPYTLDNLRLVTWAKNSFNYKADILKGVDLRTSKAVNQYDLTGKLIATYQSLHEAERCTTAKAGNICRCCTGKYKTSKGHVWRYADE